MSSKRSTTSQTWLADASCTQRLLGTRIGRLYILNHSKARRRKPTANLAVPNGHRATSTRRPPLLNTRSEARPSSGVPFSTLTYRMLSIPPRQREPGLDHGTRPHNPRRVAHHWGFRSQNTGWQTTAFTFGWSAPVSSPSGPDRAVPDATLPSTIPSPNLWNNPSTPTQ